MKVTILHKFVDKHDFSKEYKPGDVVESFDEARIKELTDKGLVEAEGTKESKDPVMLTDIDMAQGWQKVVSDVKTFGDLDKLKAYLDAESKTDKPRNSVVSALEARIKELTPAE